MSEYKLSVIVPCYFRPQRTIRAINCVLKQSFVGYHALFLFDGCPYYDYYKSNGVFNIESNTDNKIEFIQTEHYGGWGYHQRNLGREMAQGEYTIFYDNDDVILANHFENYYNGIAEMGNDMVYFNSFVDISNQLRNTELDFGMVGHSEIIVKTSLLKTLPPQNNQYGHDYELVKDILSRTDKVQKHISSPTYIVKSLSNIREIGID